MNDTKHAPIALIVDDDRLVAETVHGLVETIGLDVLGPARTIHDAEALLRSTRPDVALLDYHLGGQTTEPLLAPLRAAGIPILILSGHGPAELSAAFGGTVFLKKPFTYRELKDALQKLGLLNDGSSGQSPPT